MPDVTRQWWKWHVLKKHKEFLGHLYTKRSNFRDDFHKIGHHMMMVDEFKKAWADLMDAYRLQKTTYSTQLHEVRTKWEKPDFKGKFCAKMTSTQRSESANHMSPWAALCICWFGST
ncbi:hypothetical protein VPH35_032803 [Triticum aestivum]